MFISIGGVIIIFGIFLCVGRSLFVFMRQREQFITTYIVYGFIATVALFEMLSMPFLVYKQGFTILCFLSFFIFAGLIIHAVFDFIKKKPCLVSSKIGIVQCLFLVGMLVQIFVVSYMHYDSYDDGYYIAVSNAAIEQDVIELNDTVVYGGNYLFEQSCTRPGIQSWELFIALLSKLLKIHPAIMYHTILPLVLIPLYYMAFMEIFRKITLGKTERWLCLLIALIMSAFCGNGYLVCSYITAGTWMGKAVLFFAVLPLLMSNFIEIVNDNNERQTWIKIGILAVAGVAATATGIYTVPIYCATAAIPYCLQLVIQRKFEKLIIILKKMSLSMLGIIFIGIYAIYQIIKSGNNWAENYNTWSCEVLYRKAFLENMEYTVLAVLALLLLVFNEKNRYFKRLIVGQILVIFVILLNPISAEFIATYITGTPTHWRMVLLLPIYIVIPLGVVYVTRIFQTKIVQYTLTSIVLAIIINNSETSMLTIYTKHQNPYMIYQDFFDVIQEFDLSDKKTVTILAKQSDNKLFRQYSSYFNVVVGRNDQIKMDELGIKYIMMYKEIFEENIINRNTLELLEHFGVEYIVTDHVLQIYEGVTLEKKVNQFYIYEKNKMNTTKTESRKNG